MSTTGLKVFDATLQKTNAWLNAIMEETGWDDRHHAYSVLRAVLHAVRDRLTPDEAVKLGAQLPMLIRGMYYEGWHPGNKPLKYRHKDDFLDRVTRESPALAVPDLERAITAVFHALTKHVSNGETEHVRRLLPPEIRELWVLSAM